MIDSIVMAWPRDREKECSARWRRAIALEKWLAGLRADQGRACELERLLAARGRAVAIAEMERAALWYQEREQEALQSEQEREYEPWYYSVGRSARMSIDRPAAPAPNSRCVRNFDRV